MPGAPWRETGEDTVAVRGSRAMRARFPGGMAPPVEREGEVTGRWPSGAAMAPRGGWRFRVDRTVTARGDDRDAEVAQ